MQPAEKYALFLLEKYRVWKKLSTKESFDAFAAGGIFAYINETFAAIHTEDTAFVLGQIDEQIKRGAKCIASNE